MRIPAATRDRRIWLRVGVLLDGTGTQPRKNAHVVYSKDEILFAGEDLPPAEIIQPGQQTPDLDLAEYTLLPGLVDAHTHMFLEGGELGIRERTAYQKQTPEELLRLARARLKKLLRLGVIGVRDAGDKHGVGLALSRLCESADRPLMPYVDSPGAAIHRDGRYGGFIGGPMEGFVSARECVESRVKAGADRIKLIATGVINFKKGAVTTEPQMTTNEIRELVSGREVVGETNAGSRFRR